MNIPDFCINCNGKMGDKEKEMGIPVCQNCIDLLGDSLMKKMSGIDTKKISDKIDNFTRFILSSGNLMDIDDLLMSQCCFNGFMKSVANIENMDTVLAEKVFKQAMFFMNKELGRIESKREKNEGNDKFRSFMEGIISKSHKNNGGESDKKGINDKKEIDDNKCTDDKKGINSKKGKRIDVE